MSKFLADENIWPAIIQFLRLKGFDVKDVYDLGLVEAPDTEIMKVAQREERVILTFDKHFANILRYPLDSHYGVIRIRIHPPVFLHITQALEHFLNQFDLTTIHQTLIIVQGGGFRVRRWH
jgi:predicted nuclease of predicted toxin-antitoxin system